MESRDSPARGSHPADPPVTERTAWHLPGLPMLALGIAGLAGGVALDVPLIWATARPSRWSCSAPLSSWPPRSIWAG
jgi:hypothetical protein